MHPVDGTLEKREKMFVMIFCAIYNQKTAGPALFNLKDADWSGQAFQIIKHGDDCFYK